MDYATFRRSWDEALKRSGLVREKEFVEERLGLTSMDRHGTLDELLKARKDG